MSMGFLMKSLLADFGIAVGTLVKGALQEGVEVFSDSSAARVFAQRKGLGRQKHVTARPCTMAVGTRQAVNVADALTKPVASTTMNRQLKSMGFEHRQSWIALHRRLKPG
eukprot:735870-Amphidinium_carterae.1